MNIGMRIACASIGIVTGAGASLGECEFPYPGQMFPTGEYPWRTGVADLNDDGHLDVVTSNANGGSLSVLLGRPGAGFESQVEYEVDGTPEGLAIADFDGDGDEDLLVALSYENLLALLRNEGDGTFLAPEYQDTDGRANAVAIADFDLDGDVDVALTDGGNDSATIWTNDGTGAWTKTQVLATGQGPSSICAADLDQDGRVDLAVPCGPSDGITILLNQGGAFSPGVAPPISGYSNDIRAGDLDGDGDIDLAVCHSNNDDESSAEIFLNEGDATFAPPVQYATFAPIAFSLSMGDLDADGDLDLAVATFDANSGSSSGPADSITLLVNNGNGQFQRRQQFGVGARPRSIQMLDTDDDEIPDLLVTAAQDAALGVLRGLGDGQFEAAEELAVGRSPVDLIVSDLDQDGRPDLATACASDDTISVFRNMGNGEFQASDMWAAGYSPGGLVAADLSGDGVSELAVLNRLSHEVTVFQNLGGMIFRALGSVDVDIFTSGLFAADMDGDGDTDLLCSGSRSFTVLFNDGQGDLALGNPVEHDLFRFESGAIGDLNQDGLADYVLVTEESGDPGQIVWFLNNGDGSFDVDGVMSGPVGPGALEIGDLDQDGWPDLAVTSYVDFAAHFHANDCFGGFRAAVVHQLPSGRRAAGLHLADLDLDGDNDVICYTTTEDFISMGELVFLLENVGDLSFNTLGGPTLGRYPVAFAVADLNGDGAQDLATANQWGDSISLLFNRCPAPCPGDVDGDGDTDQSDLALLLVTYEKPPGDPLFDPRGDLNGDGEVGQSDLGVLLTDYDCGV